MRYENATSLRITVAAALMLTLWTVACKKKQSGGRAPGAIVMRSAQPDSLVAYRTLARLSRTAYPSQGLLKGVVSSVSDRKLVVRVNLCEECSEPRQNEMEYELDSTIIKRAELRPGTQVLLSFDSREGQLLNVWRLVPVMERGQHLRSRDTVRN